MINTNKASRKGTNFGDKEPSIHEAAYLDDVDYMFHCLDEGQDFSDKRGDDGMTAVHVACFNHSHRFLVAAINTGQVNPWMRDNHDRTPFDLASAIKDRIAMRLLYEEMYDGPHGPKPDAEIREFPLP